MFGKKAKKEAKGCSSKKTKNVEASTDSTKACSSKASSSSKAKASK